MRKIPLVPRATCMHSCLWKNNINNLFVVFGLLFQSWHISETWHWWCIDDWRVPESFPLPCKSKQNHILVKRRVRDYSGIWRCVGRCTEPKCSTAWEQHVHNSHGETSTFEGVLQQSSWVKHTLIDSISELIIWKRNWLVIPVTCVKFKSAFLHA